MKKGGTPPPRLRESHCRSIPPPAVPAGQPGECHLLPPGSLGAALHDINELPEDISHRQRNEKNGSGHRTDERHGQPVEGADKAAGFFIQVPLHESEPRPEPPDAVRGMIRTLSGTEVKRVFHRVILPQTPVVASCKPQGNEPNHKYSDISGGSGTAACFFSALAPRLRQYGIRPAYFPKALS